MSAEPPWRDVVFSSGQLPQDDASAHTSARVNESVRMWKG